MTKMKLQFDVSFDIETDDDTTTTQSILLPSLAEVEKVRRFMRKYFEIECQVYLLIDYQNEYIGYNGVPTTYAVTDRTFIPTDKDEEVDMDKVVLLVSKNLDAIRERREAAIRRIDADPTLSDYGKEKAKQNHIHMGDDSCTTAYANWLKDVGFTHITKKGSK